MEDLRVLLKSVSAVLEVVSEDCLVESPEDDSGGVDLRGKGGLDEKDIGELKALLVRLFVLLGKHVCT
jgi:hypothetical protein